MKGPRSWASGFARRRCERRGDVLVIVQNLSVPLDRRVWLECGALRDAGYGVSVICPAGPGDPPRRELEGVFVYTYPPAPPARGLLGYAVEFGYSWARTAWLSLVVWRQRGFSVLQACNPPDTYWALARLWQVRGVRFVFDQHDLNPELYLSRFGTPTSVSGRSQLRALKWLERRTYDTAAAVIVTNESYRRTATQRGGVDPRSIAVVRSGPDTRVMRPVYSDPGARERYLLVYLGIMGPQDGVEQTLLLMHDLVHRRGRRDIHLALLGFGDCYDQLRRQSTELALDDHVTFTGRASAAVVADYLSAADVGLCPDLKTPLNDLSTMNKVMEYMAYCLPSVSYDLVESRVSAADTAVFVDSGNLTAFADAVEALLDDDDRRVRMGLRARERVVAHLDWSRQSEIYVRVFEKLLGERPAPATGRGWRAEGPASHRPRVPLDDLTELTQFIRYRTRARHSLDTVVAEEAKSA